MQDGTRGRRGGTSHSRRKTQAPGGEQEETAYSSTRQSSKQQARQGWQQQQHQQQQQPAARSKQHGRAAGSHQQQASSVRQAQPAATPGAQGAEKTSAPASQKGPPVPSIFEEWASKLKMFMSRPVWRENERCKNAVTYPQPKTNRTH